MRYELKMPNGDIIGYDGQTWVTPRSAFTSHLNYLMTEDIMDFGYHSNRTEELVTMIADVFGAEIVKRPVYRDDYPKDAVF